MSRKHSTRRLQIESLEARQLMAADLYLDFGTAFWNSSKGPQSFRSKCRPTLGSTPQRMIESRRP